MTTIGGVSSVATSYWIENLHLFFFYQGFLSRTLTTHRTAGEGRGPSFIPLYHFHPLTNIQILQHLQLCMWDDYHIFLIASLAFTRLLLDEIYHLMELPFWLNDDMTLSVCLFTWWFDSSFFVIASWAGNPVDSNSHRLLPLYYKWNN